MPTPDKPNPLMLMELRANAKVLAESLQNEREALALNHSSDPAPLKEIYDSVYLPRTTALAAGLAGFQIPELELLCEPLDANRAPTQLHSLIALLHSIVTILSPN